jgi:hypothetical protein
MSHSYRRSVRQAAPSLASERTQRSQGVILLVIGVVGGLLELTASTIAPARAVFFGAIIALGGWWWLRGSASILRARASSD